MNVMADTAHFVSTAAAPETAAPGPPAEKSGSMRTVFLLVGIAIVVFMAFTVNGIYKEMAGRAQLAAIKDVHFPVLQRLDANIVRIDKIESLFIEVAVTGDNDLIDKAKALGVEADQAYGEIGSLQPAQARGVTRLREDLKKYQELATKASMAFLQSQGADTESMAAMNQALADARLHLKDFRDASYEAFVSTLSSSQRNSSTRLIMGLALGAMNLAFMAVLVYFIRKNIKMMAVIAHQNRTLEHRVAERTAELSQKTSDINAMLQNMKLGVSTVVAGNRIHPEHSRYLSTIFGVTAPGGQELVPTLFGKSTLGVDAKDQIAVSLGSILGEDAMMFTLNGHLLSQETQLTLDDGSHKIVQMEWSPIVNPETNLVDKVLLITQDVTHLRELELASAHQKEELEIISKIIKVSIGKFNDFIHSATGFIEDNRRLITAAAGRENCDVSALFRNMHTIKGNARTFEFTHITNAAHQAEQSYDRLRKDPAAPWTPDVYLTELAEVEAAVTHYKKVSEDKLGRKGRGSDLLTTRGAFVANEQLAELRSLVNQLAAKSTDSQLAQLRQTIQALGMIPLSRLVSSSVDSMSSLADELKKPVPAVEIVNGDDVSFNVQFSESLKSCLMHMIRNSLDHGIEAPEERARANKDARGTLRFICERKSDNHIELHISDDGRGLALHKLYEKGVAGGLFSGSQKPTRGEVADVLFRSGLSTAEQVTQVSGRGVGMDAVRAFLKEQNASVRVALKESDEALGFAPFEFIISVPSAACGHAA
jgi:HPt (histidine-containing phosphotransfer) domain-containing protein